ncbi:hypothetical protein LB505_003662 [Fusarium chuoi]|nr:hypothetical protein LB505_003662 [Fusarium chuoi]
MFSYAQVRGSVPVFWEQAADLIPGRQKITVTRSSDGTQPAFNKHFEELEQSYGAVHVINLLSETKPGEVELSTLYHNGIKHFVLAQTDLRIMLSCEKPITISTQKQKGQRGMRLREISAAILRTPPTVLPTFLRRRQANLDMTMTALDKLVWWLCFSRRVSSEPIVWTVLIELILCRP